MSRVSYDGGKTFKVFEKPEDVTDLDAKRFLNVFLDRSVMAKNYNGDKMLTPVRTMIIPAANHVYDESKKHKYTSIATQQREVAKELLGTCGDVDFIVNLEQEIVLTVKCDTNPREPEYFVINNYDMTITI